MRVAALEDNVAFLERWCEEQQDALDRAIGSVAYDYEVDSELTPPTLLRIVDLRDDADDEDGDTIVAILDPEPDHALRVLRSQLTRLRIRLAASLAPGELSDLSAKPAGRTAP